MENVVDEEQPQSPEGQGFRRWAIETIVVVALALLAFIGGVIAFRALTGDEVAPGEQLNRMITEENQQNEENRAEKPSQA